MSQMNNGLASQVLRLAIPTWRFQKESWDRNGCPRSSGQASDSARGGVPATPSQATGQFSTQ